MPANTLFEHPWGVLVLQRFPVPRDYSLVAFNAADAYLLEHLQAGGLPDGPIWVVNDDFGALSLAIQGREVVWMGDRWTAWHALELNARANGVSLPARRWLTDAPEELPSPAAVLMQVPKESDLLAFQLALLSQVIRTGIPVWAGGMTRNIHTKTVEAFSSFIGPTSTTLAQKKARLILSVADGKPRLATEFRSSYIEPHTGATVISLPGVFSADHPDPGSALLAQAVPAYPAGTRLVDVGCGNGYFLAVMGRRSPGIVLAGVDDSALAVASARATMEANGLEADLRLGHALADLAPGSVDVAVCNPPFHQGHARHDALAWDMFHGARQALSDEGELWVVGNRNLGYHIPLGRLYKKVEVAAADPKYTVFRCRKR